MRRSHVLAFFFMGFSAALAAGHDMPAAGRRRIMVRPSWM
jgi:hypothetical protein